MKLRITRQEDWRAVLMQAHSLAIAELVSDERAEFHAALSKLLGAKWPVA